MPIPFIRKDPNGKRSLLTIDRPSRIKEKAAEFIDGGGCYLAEIMPDGKAHIMAIIDKAEGCTKVADEIVPNGPELPKAVDRLIEESVKHVAIKLLVPANKNLEIVK